MCRDGTNNGTCNTSDSTIILIFCRIVVAVMHAVPINFDLQLAEGEEVLDTQIRSTIQALPLMHTECELHMLKIWHWSHFIKLQRGPTTINTKEEIFQTSESVAAMDNDPPVGASGIF
jgi:hypothetical protein